MTHAPHAETWLASARPDAAVSSPVFARPTARRVRAWQTDAAGRAALARFIEDRGAARPRAAVLCALYWLERFDPGGAGGAGDDDAAVGTTGREIGARYPFHRGRRLTSAASLLASLARSGLAQSIAVGWYGTTALGRAVVEAMPDVDQVARLRGLRRRPGRRFRADVA